MIDFTGFPVPKDIFYISIIIIGTLYFYIHHGTNDDKSLTGYNTPKDHFYRVLILSILLITIVTSKLGNNNEVVGYIGFAGTLVSIILGLLAIGITLKNSLIPELILAKLNEATRNLDGQSSKFDETAQDILTFVGDRFDTVDKQHNEYMTALQKDTHDVKNEQSVTVHNESNSPEIIKEYILGVIEKTTFQNIKYAMIREYLTSKLGRKKGIATFKDFLVSIDELGKQESTIDTLYGIWPFLHRSDLMRRKDDRVIFTDELNDKVENDLLKKFDHYESFLKLVKELNS